MEARCQWVLLKVRLLLLKTSGLLCEAWLLVSDACRLWRNILCCKACRLGSYLRQELAVRGLGLRLLDIRY